MSILTIEPTWYLCIKKNDLKKLRTKDINLWLTRIACTMLPSVTWITLESLLPSMNRRLTYGTRIYRRHSEYMPTANFLFIIFIRSHTNFSISLFWNLSWLKRGASCPDSNFTMGMLTVLCFNHFYLHLVLLIYMLLCVLFCACLYITSRLKSSIELMLLVCFYICADFK